MTGIKACRHVAIAAIFFGGVCVFDGCAKKEADAPTAAADPATPKRKEDPAVAQDLQAVQKDLSAREYERAAASIMRMQDMAPMMSEKDSQRLAAQMRNVQGAVAQAAAAGDPKAQNAIAMLRMMSRENQMPTRR